MPRKNKNTHYNGGIIRPTDAGTFRAEVNHDYKQIKKTLPTILLAKEWIDETRNLILNKVDTLGALDQRDALEAMRILPDGVSLRDAAQFYADNHVDATLTVLEAIEGFLSDKAAAGLRPRSISTLRFRMHAIAEGLGDRPLIEVSTEHLEEWLSKYHGESRKNYRKELSGLFAWSMRRGFAKRNPAQAITVPRSDAKLPEFLTPEQMQALLWAAERDNPKLIPFIVLGGYAGLRRAELERLDSSCVRGHILVSASAAKVREQRFVTILPALEKWLKAYPPSGPITSPNLRREMERVIDAAGIRPWPNNALRHSFATYHLALYQDAGKTAHELGHTSPDLLYRHYRGLAKMSDSEAYFGIDSYKIPTNKS